MNSLEIKKRAFMSVVTRRYGFIRTKSGAPPLTLTNCLSGNLVDYKIFGNVGKNLIPYPYAETTKTVGGITFTDNSDGSITVNGTATANAIFYIYREQKRLLNNLNAGDDFTFSVTADNTWSSSATMYLICNFYNSSGSMVSGGFVQSPDEAYRKKTIKISDEHFGMAVYLIVYKGKTINNVTVKPMIEKGVDATEYEPYKRVGDLDGDKYKIPIMVGNNTTNIFLSAPLGIGESADYKTDSLPDIFVSEGTNIIIAETEVKPSAIEVKYRSSIEEG